MKKLISILLAAAFLLCSCGSKADTPHIAKTVYSSLSTVYLNASLSDYRVIAALANAGEDLSKCALSLETPDGRVESGCSYLLSVYFAKKGGADVTDYPTGDTLTDIVARFADMPSLSCREMFLCVASLSLYGVLTDAEAAAADIEKRQDVVSGGFYAYAPTGSEVSSTDVLSSAYAYTALVILNDAADPMALDSAILFLGESIGDDNTLSDISGKSSCSVTAAALTAMLASGIPTDGEIATALLEAIHRFPSGSGYADSVGGVASLSVGAEVLLCASSSLYGNPFTARD